MIPESGATPPEMRAGLEIKTPAPAAASAGVKEELSGNNAAQPTPCKRKIKPGTKIHSVLSYLATGQSLNRFEGYRILHDSVLNTSVSHIEKLGIVVSRENETVPGHNNSLVYCSRYWLDLENQKRAALLLGST